MVPDAKDPLRPAPIDAGERGPAIRVTDKMENALRDARFGINRISPQRSKRDRFSDGGQSRSRRGFYRHGGACRIAA
jgi:hypothetical protein